MKSLKMLPVVVIVLLVLLFVGSYMFTYTVRFNELAVKTAAGRAADNVQSQPGRGFKIPGWNSITKYDGRTRFFESKLETQQTRDNRQVVVTAYATWRVSDAKLFYERFSNAGSRAEQHYKAAQDDIIQEQLRSALAEISKYRLDELLSLGSGASKLTELEARMQAALSDKLAAQGIGVSAVGLTSIKLPQQVTTAVFERMKQERRRMAKAITDDGAAQAEAIRSRAKANARKITEFAKALAGEIRQQGDREAGEYLAQMNENQELAVYIKQMEFMRSGLGDRATMVIPLSTPGFELFRLDALDRLEPGQIPTTVLNRLMQSAADEVREAATEAPARDEETTEAGPLAGGGDR